MAGFNMKSFSYGLLSFAKVVYISFNTNCGSIICLQVRRTEEYTVKLEVEVW